MKNLFWKLHGRWGPNTPDSRRNNTPDSRRNNTPDSRRKIPEGPSLGLYREDGRENRKPVYKQVDILARRRISFHHVGQNYSC